MREIKSKRKPFSKTFDLGGGRRRLVTSVLKLHYLDDDKVLRTIDLTPDQTEDGLVVKKCDYYFRAFKNRIGGVFKSGVRGQFTLLLDELDGVPVADLTLDTSKVTISQGKVVWEDVVEGLDIILKFRPSGVEYFKIVKTPQGPHALTWKCIESKGARFRTFQKARATDSASLTVRLSRETKEVRDFTKSRSYKVVEEVSRDTVSEVVSKKTRQRKWRKRGLTYPLKVDADITEGITADADDGYQLVYTTGTSGFYTSSSNRVGGNPEFTDTVTFTTPGGSTTITFTRTQCTINMATRFQGIAIPQGATIDSAKLKLYRTTKTDAAQCPEATIYGHDVDDAGEWAFNSDFADLPKTTASKALGTVEQGWNEFDVKDIVQEIVNRAGFASNNNIGFMILGNYDSGEDACQREYFYDYAYGMNAPSFEIDYTESGATTTSSSTTTSSTSSTASSTSSTVSSSSTSSTASTTSTGITTSSSSTSSTASTTSSTVSSSSTSSTVSTTSTSSTSSTSSSTNSTSSTASTSSSSTTSTSSTSTTTTSSSTTTTEMTRCSQVRGVLADETGNVITGKAVSVDVYRHPGHDEHIGSGESTLNGVWRAGANLTSPGETVLTVFSYEGTSDLAGAEFLETVSTSTTTTTS